MSNNQQKHTKTRSPHGLQTRSWRCLFWSTKKVPLCWRCKSQCPLTAWQNRDETEPRDKTSHLNLPKHFKPIPHIKKIYGFIGKLRSRPGTPPARLKAWLPNSRFKRACNYSVRLKSIENTWNLMKLVHSIPFDGFQMLSDQSFGSPSFT